MFTRNGDFHYDLAQVLNLRYDVPNRNKKANLEIDKVIAILNTLTPEQEAAVRTFGYSRYEEGYDTGRDYES